LTNEEEEELNNRYEKHDYRQIMRQLYLNLLGGRKFHFQIKAGIRKGLDILNEPILGNIVRALHLSTYLNMRKKARIQIPKSATLIGVVDDTGLLEPHEIFVQIRKDSFASPDAKKKGKESDDEATVEEQ